MPDSASEALPPGFTRGPLQGGDLIGEITEAVHRWLLDGWPESAGRAPRIEEDLSFVPKDREEVVYVYMYRVAQNDDLKNPRRFRASHLAHGREGGDADLLFERAPLFLHVYYLIAVHSRFRSEAERLLGWAMMRLNDASHLIYRPRRYLLPDGDAVDSLGRPYERAATGEVEMEKVALGLVDDLTVGDAVNFFTIHEAPYRPYLTYRAMCAMRGPMVRGPATRISVPAPRPWSTTGAGGTRPSGRMPQGVSGAGPTSEHGATGAVQKPIIGPPGFDHRPVDGSAETAKNPASSTLFENPDSED